MNRHETNVYQWTFEIQDVVKFEETSITVTCETYEQAIKKIKALKIPQLRTYDDIDEGLKLTQVYEVESDFDSGQFPELENKEDDD
jgi:hypothetical protein